MSRQDVRDAHRVTAAPASQVGLRPDSSQGNDRSTSILGSALHAAAFAHDSYGNDIVAASLSGAALDGIGPLVAGDLTFALGGVGGSVEGDLGSNQVMGRAMRDFEAQDYDSSDPSLALLQTSGGDKLPERIRARFERALGHDFGHVRVHRDGLAAAQSAALNAHAFTIDNHIWFGSSEWAPGTPQGDRLIAHELTHVIQHDEGRIHPAGGGMNVSSPSDPLELEAYATETSVLSDLRSADQELSQEPAGLTDAPAMRRRSSPAEPDTEAAEQAVRVSAGGKLPSGVADRMSRVLGHDFSGVRVHTDSAADQAARALHARAFALGADLFFAEGEYDPHSASGQELIAHELTHVVQAAEGRLPSAGGDGLQVSDPNESAEREAYAVESAFSSGAVDVDHESSSTSTSTASGGSLTAHPAMRAAAEEQEEASAPDQVEFKLGSTTLVVDIDGDSLRQRIEIHEELVPGLLLETGTIHFDEEWNLRRGMIEAKLTIGELIEDVSVSVAVGRDGRVNATIQNVHIPMPGDLISGTMDLDITEEGVGGEATFTAEQIQVGEGFSLTDGSLTIRIAPGGSAECEGTLHGAIADTLEFTLTAHFDETRLAGNLESNLEEPVDLGYNIQITGGSLGGEFHHEQGTTVSGGLAFDLAGWASAELRATVVLPGSDGDQSETEQTAEPEVQEEPEEPAGLMARFGNMFSGGASDTTAPEPEAPSQDGSGGGVQLSFPTPGRWGLQGTVNQDRDLTVGDGVTVTGAQAVISINDGALEPVQIPTATVLLPDNWQAVITDGSYDVGEPSFSGEVEVSLTEDLELGEGLTVESVTATGTLESNELVRVTGELEAVFEVEGAPRLRILVEEFDYDVQGGELSCEGTVVLEEAFEVFEHNGYSLSLLPESSLTAEIEASEVEAIRGDLKFKLTEDGEDFISAELSGRYPLHEDEEFEGTLDARLDAPRRVGESLLITDLEASAEIEGENIRIHSGTMVAYLESEDLPNFRIEFEEIEYDVNERMLDGFAVITLDEDVLLEGEDSKYSLFLAAEGSDLRGTIEESELTLVEGTVGMMLREDGEDFIFFELEAEYPLHDGGSLTGTATATLMDEREVGTVGGQKLFLVDGSSLTAHINESAVESISGELTISVRDGEEEWARAIFNGTYELGEEGSGYTGEARVELTKEQELRRIGSYTLVITAEEGELASATAHFEENSLTKIDGSIPLALNDEEGNAVLVGSLTGEYVLDGGNFSGTGSLHTATFIDIDVSSSTKLRIAEGSGGTVTVSDNALTTISAELTASVFYDEVEQFEFTGEGEFDVAERKVSEATGTASLLRVLEPFGEGKLQVSNLEAQARIRDSELVEVSGGADVLLPILNDSRGRFDGTYSRSGGEDRFSGEAGIRLVVIPEQNGRKAIGDIDFTFDGTGNFTASGDLDYSLTEAVSGTIGMTMDQELDPEIRGTLEIESELVPAAELFRKEIDLLPERAMQLQAGPVPLTFRYGAKAGFGLGMRAMVLTSSIEIPGWRPISEASTVPDFNATANIDWGLDFDAMAAAWMSLSIGVPVLSAGAGIRGEAKLEVPITTGAEVNLHGENNQFWGDLGVSMAIGGGLTFNLIPFLTANVFWQEFRHDFDGWEWTLDDIIDFEWGKVYEFGDRQGERDQAAVEEPIGSPTQLEAEHTEAPDFGGDQSNAPAQVEGGPDLSGASSLVGEGESGGEQSELEQRMEQVQTIAEGLAAIGYLVEQIGDLLRWAVLGGVFGLAIRLVYKMIIREITWDRLSTAVRDAIAGIRAAYEMIQPYLPDWWQALQDLIDRGVNLFDEWWNGDTRMHEAVRAGEHRHAGPEMKAEMVDRMLDFWAQEDHKISVIMVLESGDADYVISQVGWSKIRGKMTNMLTSGRVERRFQQFAEQNGYGRWETSRGFFGGTSRDFVYND